MDYPVPAYNYTVSISGTTLAFASVSGLDLGYNIGFYKHGLSFREGAQLIVGIQDTIRLTMTRGIFRSGQLAQMYQWISNQTPEQPEERDVTVQLCDASGQAVVTWQATGCVPAKLSAPALAANSNDVAIATLELIASNLTMSFPSSS